MSADRERRSGAYQVHKKLRERLKRYIHSQYFGKNLFLYNQISSKLDESGVLYQVPYIEASRAYLKDSKGFSSLNLPNWEEQFFLSLASNNLGVFKTPYTHQIQAFDAYRKGEEFLVATGTGSGKTECFMWPMLSKLVNEARNHADTWNEQRGARVFVLYPMNALVSDQVSRMRKMLGSEQFVQLFRDAAGADSRRPQFGMYTGRTPYPGSESNKSNTERLVKTLQTFMAQKPEFLQLLKEEGKVPAKKDLNLFIENLKKNKHITDPEDTEMITRFEMQNNCPDILITNYSMLEYMLFRPREQKIWRDTSKWLKSSEENRLLFVMDEAHMYRGSSGGEVSYLIRRLMERLGVEQDKFQFILTTASMPDNAEEEIADFVRDLTAQSSDKPVRQIFGESRPIDKRAGQREIKESVFAQFPPDIFEGSESEICSVLTDFFHEAGASGSWQDFKEISEWMYVHLFDYKQFCLLIKQCRKEATSLENLSKALFPEVTDFDKSLQYTSTLLAIAPFAKNSSGEVLFPARMHMFFRGIKGLYACSNPNCQASHKDHKFPLGQLFLSDGVAVCPECKSKVYELYNHRRCGALFFKGYVNVSEFADSNMSAVYLWREAGLDSRRFEEDQFKEIMLYIPPADFNFAKDKIRKMQPCYLDCKSGFLYIRDDSKRDVPGFLHLYYYQENQESKSDQYSQSSDIYFAKCPQCKNILQERSITSFQTRGNEPFYNLVQAQFESQPAVPSKVKSEFPNQGRKVLLFSDSRQQAAKLARDMSETSDIQAVRQIAVMAIKEMQRTGMLSLSYFYSFFCIVASRKGITFFGDPKDEERFRKDCKNFEKHIQRRRRRKKELDANEFGKIVFNNKIGSESIPSMFRHYFLKIFLDNFNTFTDSALCWLEPNEDVLYDLECDYEEEFGSEIDRQFLIEICNAWMISDCFDAMAFDSHFNEDDRRRVRRCWQIGLEDNWHFSSEIMNIMGWKKSSREYLFWRERLDYTFLARKTEEDRLYVKIDDVNLKFSFGDGEPHIWKRCNSCSRITPYLLKGHCPYCGSDKTVDMVEPEEYKALSFWRNQVLNSYNNEDTPIHIIDTEEHTAQLSSRDQRERMWSQTEEYEMAFQDIVEEGKRPVDILSCTTTMEVGIDIGSLVAVGLRNMPPMRENYQQRAGRAGRRGSSLSTILTFCGDRPHDVFYFHHPDEMLNGEPRTPWIDMKSEKLLYRHLTIVVLRRFLSSKYQNKYGIDSHATIDFFDKDYEDFLKYIKRLRSFDSSVLCPSKIPFDINDWKKNVRSQFEDLKKSVRDHVDQFFNKNMLDALYEKGIIPTYSFPKNVVNLYIPDTEKSYFEINRGLDIAISEYAPGRGLVVNKKTYQIGGIYSKRSEFDRNRGCVEDPARSYFEDESYCKEMSYCDNCGWFGLSAEIDRKKKKKDCPFCGHAVREGRKLLRPWGFAPRNHTSIAEAQLAECYTSAMAPRYSTLPSHDDMQPLSAEYIKAAVRENQAILVLNRGYKESGFVVCKKCGAAMPGDNPEVLNNLKRPYVNYSNYSKCKHEAENVDLGFRFVTDMLVLQISLNNEKVSSFRKHSDWLIRAAASLSEALRLVAGNILDIEFSELVSGSRIRRNRQGVFVDIYLYDNLSSGAGYSGKLKNILEQLFKGTLEFLKNCKGDCDSACYECLKHYRNQYLHASLNRFYALDLLKWGLNGELPDDFSLQEQWDFLKPVLDICEESGVRIWKDNQKGAIFAEGKGIYEIFVYPALRSCPEDCKECVYVSDFDLTYNLPYVVAKIIENAKTSVD